MEVIGMVNDNEFLFKATKGELSKFMGFSDKYYLGADKKSQLKVGGVVEVSEIYKRATLTLESYEELYNKFLSIKKQLNKLTDLMRGKEIIKEED